MYVWSTNAAVMLEEKVIGDVNSQDIQVYWICAIFLATLRFVCSIQNMCGYTECSKSRQSGGNQGREVSRREFAEFVMEQDHGQGSRRLPSDPLCQL